MNSEPSDTRVLKIKLTNNSLDAFIDRDVLGRRKGRRLRRGLFPLKKSRLFSGETGETTRTILNRKIHSEKCPIDIHYKNVCQLFATLYS